MAVELSAVILGANYIKDSPGRGQHQVGGETSVRGQGCQPALGEFSSRLTRAARGVKLVGLR